MASASLKKRPLQRTRQICSLKINRIWQEILYNENETNSGVEIVKLANALSVKYPALSKDEWAAEIRYAVQDGLLTMGERANKIGRSLTFVVGRPTSELPIEEKGNCDWFCFKCHKHGDLVRCRDCTKAYHVECLPKNWATVIFGVMGKVCPSCELIYNKPSMAKIPDTKMLNEMLVFLSNGVGVWKIPILNNAVGFEWAKVINSKESEGWRISYLVYSPIDVRMIHKKASQGRYLSLEEFQVDCETLAHNLGVFFGVEMLQKGCIGHDFLNRVHHGIDEIKLCHDCFYYSNKKDDNWWFCKPCTVPHEVVWAKTPGYPAWPAKVLRRFNGKCEVRFFGDPHFRCVLPASHVQPITASVQKSGRSEALEKAVAELEVFQNKIVTG